MPSTRRLFKSFSRLLLPVLLLLAGAGIGASVWLVFQSSQAPKNNYLITPDKYAQLSSRGAQITDEHWINADGTTSRGWLLRGTPGSPAVVMLHAYGTDRSYLLNLGVKLNEATDFTILMPDQRGHGEKPLVRFSTLGGCETDDAIAAIKYLRGLKVDETTPLVGQNIGIYGTEMGALVGAMTAAKDETVKSLALDSVPANSDDLLAMVINKRFPFASSLTSRFAKLGTPLFFYNGCYRSDSVCEVAKNLENRHVLLLAGGDNAELQSSTTGLSRCFPNSAKIESKTDLYPSGTNLVNASLQQFEEYDNRVVAFFRQSLGVVPPVQ
ncbi:MAG: hypothetical protein IPJ30_12435 [Acidobacteria bacterium]|nr:hypothetical protein [Acidobacteriota bacterium]